MFYSASAVASLLECDAMLLGKQFVMFRRIQDAFEHQELLLLVVFV